MLRTKILQHYRVITQITKTPPHIVHSSWCTITAMFSEALERDIDVTQVMYIVTNNVYMSKISEEVLYL